MPCQYFPKAPRKEIHPRWTPSPSVCVCHHDLMARSDIVSLALHLALPASCTLSYNWSRLHCSVKLAAVTGTWSNPCRDTFVISFPPCMTPFCQCSGSLQSPISEWLRLAARILAAVCQAKSFANCVCYITKVFGKSGKNRGASQARSRCRTCIPSSPLLFPCPLRLPLFGLPFQARDVCNNSSRLV